MSSINVKFDTTTSFTVSLYAKSLIVFGNNGHYEGFLHLDMLMDDHFAEALSILCNNMIDTIVCSILEINFELVKNISPTEMVIT